MDHSSSTSHWHLQVSFHCFVEWVGHDFGRCIADYFVVLGKRQVDALE